MKAYVTLPPETSVDDPLLVNVVQDSSDGTWIATSDEIPIATEAATFEELVQRVWSIAPELAALNGYAGELRLRFFVDTRAG